MAQQEVELQFRYTPETRYVTEMVMSNYNRITFEGNDELMQEMRAAGMEMPFIMIMDQKVVSVMLTGIKDNLGLIPWKISFEEFEITASQGGEGMNLDMEGITDIEMEGLVDTLGKMRMESVSGPFEHEYEQVLTGIIENLSNQITFPDQSIKVGESFVTTHPVNIPLGVMGRFDMYLETEYILNAIEDNLAFFDVTIKMTMESDMADATMFADGEGSGTMIFDVDQNFAVEDTSEISLTMRMETNGFTVIGFSKNFSSKTISINR